MSERTQADSAHRRLAAPGLSILGVVAVIGAIVVALLALPAPTARGSGTGGGGGCFSTSGPVCTFHQQSASASFGSFDPVTCIVTEGDVEAFSSLARPGGASAQGVFVSIFVFNPCTGTSLEGVNNVDPNTGNPVFTGSVSLGSHLTGGSISGTAPMFDSNTLAFVFTTSINISWTAFGPTTTQIDSFHVHAPGFILNTHFHGTQRDATASGTFTNSDGSNLAQLPTEFASVASSINGTVQLSHS